MAIAKNFNPRGDVMGQDMDALCIEIAASPDVKWIKNAMEDYAKSYAESKSQEVAIDFMQWAMDNVFAKGRLEDKYWHILDDLANPIGTKELFLKYEQSKEQ